VDTYKETFDTYAVVGVLGKVTSIKRHCTNNSVMINLKDCVVGDMN